MKLRLFSLLATILLGALLPARPGSAEYYMGFQYLLSGSSYESTMYSVHDGATIDRFVDRLAFTFGDLVDSASVPGNIIVTDATGAPLDWTATTDRYTVTLTAPGVLTPASSYTFLVRGGPDGIKSLDGVPIRADLLWHVTTNSLPFELGGVTLAGGDESGNEVRNDGLMPRNTNQVRLRFTHPVTADSAAAAIRVSKQDGSAAEWTVAEVRGFEVSLAFPGRLPMARERYQITIDGTLRNVLGEPLPTTATFSLRTTDLAYRWRADLVSNWHQYGVVQNDIYRFRAYPGTLSITLWPVQGTTAAVRVTLVDDAEDRVLLDEAPVVNSYKTFSTHLPRAGSYSLQVMSNRLWEVALVGYELEAVPGTPALQMDPISPFETKNEPFPFAVAVRNPDQTERISIYLEDVTLAEGAPRPDGTVPPVTVETAALADGIYGLAVVGKALGSENRGWAAVPILVDRVAAFPDVPADHWAHRYIEVMHHLEVVGGRETGLFDPGAPVTRAEFAKLLALTLGLEADPGSENPFADTDGHWAAPHILALWQYGLVTGEVVDGQRYFYPERTSTRAEAATILGRALGLSDEPPPDEAPFADWAEVPEWARPSVAGLARWGWINGFPDGRYYPARELQRDQATKILAKFFGM